MRLWAPAFAAALLCGCVFDTRTPTVTGAGLTLRPDIALGSQAFYVTREFLRPAQGPAGDTALSFIRYSFPADTSIAGMGYRLMQEEELAYRNFDQGLSIYRTSFAVRFSGESLYVKRLWPAGTAYGRTPLKASAFDSAHFEDETVALIGGLEPGRSWALRSAGDALGHAAAAKTYLGRAPVDGRRADSAYAFQVVTQDQENIRVFEWYDADRKVFSSTAYAYSQGGADTARTEEEYLGARGFTAADTEAVLRSSGQH